MPIPSSTVVGATPPRRPKGPGSGANSARTARHTKVATSASAPRSGSSSQRKSSHSHSSSFAASSGVVAHVNVPRPDWADQAMEQQPSRVHRVVPRSVNPGDQMSPTNTHSNRSNLASNSMLRVDEPHDDKEMYRFERSTRETAMETLPLALPPIRFRRGEHPGEYESLDELKHAASAASLQRSSSSVASSPSKLSGLNRGGPSSFSMQSTAGTFAWEKKKSDTELDWDAAEHFKRIIATSTAMTEELKPEMCKAVEHVAVKLENEMVTAMAGVCKQGVHVSNRGLSVPYQWYERVSSAAIGVVDDIFTAAMVHEKEKAEREQMRGDCGSTTMGSRTTSFGNKIVVEQCSDDERDKNDDGDEEHQQENTETVEEATERLATEANFTKEVISARVEVTTAVSVAVLWRMLEQASGSLAGMRAALPLFHNLLNVVYVGFNDVKMVLPDVSSLADQIAQLVDIPVQSLQRDAAIIDAERLLRDVHYLRKAMQNWSFQIWKMQKVSEKRKDCFLERLELVVRRGARKETLHTVFIAWKKYNMMKRMSKIFHEFEQQIGEVLAPELARKANQRQRHYSIVKAVKLKGASDDDAPGGEGGGDGVTPLALATAAADAKTAADQAPMPQDEKSIAALLTFQKKMTVVTGIGSGGGGAGGEAEEGSTTKSGAKSAVLQKMDDDGYFTSPDEMKMVLDTVVEKAKNLDDVTGYLKQQITAQKERLAKVENENNTLKEKLAKTEQDLLKTVHEKLELTNTVQSLEHKIIDQQRQLYRCKSRIRSQRHKKWRNAAVRLIADIADVDTGIVETAQEPESGAKNLITPRHMNDERSLSRDEGIGGGGSNSSTPNLNKSSFGKSLGGALSATRLDIESTLGPQHSPHLHPHRNSTGDASGANEYDDGGGGPEEEAIDKNVISAEERAFAMQAPLVFRSTEQLPPAIEIVRDWANNCLADLAALDGSRLGTESATQISDFSGELKDSIIYTRLLFFLALPRYRPKSVDSSQLINVSDDCNENRDRLLMRESVQLHPPFPTYVNCFADLLRLPYNQRAQRILEFAEQLMSQFTTRANETPPPSKTQQKRSGSAHSHSRSVTPSTATTSTGKKRNSKHRNTPDHHHQSPHAPPPQPRRSTSSKALPPTSLLLQDMVNPLALAEGVKSAHITFLSLLYVRFAHPFNHKCNEHIAAEKDKMLELVVAAGGSTANFAAAASADFHHQSSSAEMAGGNNSSIFDILTKQRSFEQDNKDEDLDEDELPPWQLFVDRCQPIVGSASHSFVLDGNFWPTDVIESSELLEIFGKIVVSLRQSLRIHRWHVLVNCLTATKVYRGESRPALALASIDRTTPAELIMKYAAKLEADRSRKHSSANLLEDNESDDPFSSFVDIPNQMIVEIDTVILELLISREEVPPLPSIFDTSPQKAHPSGPMFGGDSVDSPLPKQDSMDIVPELSATAQPSQALASLTQSFNVPGTGAVATAPPESLREQRQRLEATHNTAVKEVRKAILNSLNDIVRVFLMYATTRSGDPDTLVLNLHGFRSICLDGKLAPQFISLEEISTIFSECDHAFRSRAGSLASNNPQNDQLVSNNSLGGGMMLGLRQRSSFSTGGSRKNSRRGSVTTIIEPGQEFVQEMTLEEFFEAIVRLSTVVLKAGEKAEEDAIEALKNAKLAQTQAKQLHTQQLVSNTPLLSALQGGKRAGSRVGGNTPKDASITTPFASPPAPPSLHASHTASPNTAALTDAAVIDAANPFGHTLAKAIRALAAKFFSQLCSRSVGVILDSLMRGAETAHIIRHRNTELMAVFNAYARVFSGVEGIDLTCFNRIAKDAALITHEFSFNVATELFNYCSTTIQVQATNASGTANTAAGALSAMGGSVMGTSTAGDKPAGKMIDKTIVVFDRFVDLMGLVALYKNPNPFIPFGVRLENYFVSFLKALRPKVEQLEKDKVQKQHLAAALVNKLPVGSAGGGAASPAGTSYQQSPQTRSVDPRMAGGSRVGGRTRTPSANKK